MWASTELAIVVGTAVNAAMSNEFRNIKAVLPVTLAIAVMRLSRLAEVLYALALGR